MIKGQSALDSVLERGIANDGPLNQGGLGVTQKPQSDANNHKPAVQGDANTVKATRTIKGKPTTGKAARDSRYKDQHAEELREKARIRMAAARASRKVAEK